VRKYKVIVEGRNFLIAGSTGEAKLGFYTTRFVEATDAEGAENAAVEQLRRQALREMTLNDRDDQPMYVTEIEELPSFDGLKSLDQGLVWYPENEESDSDPGQMTTRCSGPGGRHGPCHS
jgi:hypothetical protein